MRKQIKRKVVPVEVDYKQMAMQLWVDVAVAVARSDTCRYSDKPAHWADKVVADFWERVNK
jgi:hypothetical protein